MNTKKLLTLALVMTLAGSAANAQLFKKIGQAAGKAAEKTVLRKTEQKVEQTVDKTIDNVTDPNTYKSDGSNDNNSSQQNSSAQDGDDNAAAANKKNAAPANSAKAMEMTYAKSDFVPGDEIFFEDLMDNEQLGEFPSMWDLKKGSAEIASVSGKKATVRDPGVIMEIVPLMKNMKNYLPEKFTLEMDLWLTPQSGKGGNQWYKMFFYDATGKQVMEIEFDNRVNYHLGWNYKSTSGETVKGDSKPAINFEGWHHFAISFNQRAFKIYLDGIRLGNIPNMTQPANFMYSDFPMNGASGGAITNVRLAKGAVPLYDRMMSDGKIITYGITFDVGKSTIKPESMGEINRIATLMKENPDLKFSVEGHTDSTGGAAANQTLSDARSKAVADKLISMGIDADRLKAAGKGQTSPIADNNTDEGRAKNRRVEFVKIK